MKSMNPISIATRGKGLWNMIRRIMVIGRRYGLTSQKMNRTLSSFAELLDSFDVKATFPITAAALNRSNGFANNFQDDRIEFAVHGLYHVDHTQLSLPDQEDQFEKARHLFSDKGVGSTGFRSPYLRWSDETVSALKQAGFVYDSSQALA